MTSLHHAMGRDPAFAQAAYGFEETNLDEGTVFVVTPEPPPRGALFSTLALLVFLCLTAIPMLTGIVAWVLHLGRPGWLVLTALAAGGLLWADIHHIRQVQQRHRPRRIVVQPQALVLDQTRYSREHIGDLWVDSPEAATTMEPSETTTVIVGGSHAAVTGAAVGIGLQNVATDTGRRAGRALANRMNRVAHGVSMRYGARTVPVATGLTQGTAVVLAQKLRACLELRQ